MCQLVCQTPLVGLCLILNFKISKEKMVSLTFTSWNLIALWLRQLDNLRLAA